MVTLREALAGHPFRLAGLGTFLAAGVLLVSARGGGTTVQETGTGSPNIRAMQLVTTSAGWVLTDARLVWTDGVQSNDITPSGLEASAIRSVVFQDAMRGWAVAQTAASEQATELAVLRTVDGGESWTSAGTISAFSTAEGMVSADFSDEHGWVLVQLESSSNFSVGELYGTRDGGASWTKLAAPIAGQIRFASPTLGLVAGGPAGSDLYVTRDGGNSWQPVSLTAPPPFASAQPVYGVPSFTDSAHGVLPVTFVGNPSGVGFYVTADGAVSWTIEASFVIPAALEQGARFPIDVAGRSTWVVATPNGRTVFSTQDRGRSWTQVAANGLGDGVAEIDFANALSGWSRIEYGRCAGFKTDCVLIIELHRTQDGGQTWSELRP
jgi:hypothetical protein